MRTSSRDFGFAARRAQRAATTPGCRVPPLAGAAVVVPRVCSHAGDVCAGPWRVAGPGATDAMWWRRIRWERRRRATRQDPALRVVAERGAVASVAKGGPPFASPRCARPSALDGNARAGWTRTDPRAWAVAGKNRIRRTAPLPAVFGTAGLKPPPDSTAMQAVSQLASARSNAPIAATRSRRGCETFLPQAAIANSFPPAVAGDPAGQRRGQHIHRASTHEDCEIRVRRTGTPRRQGWPHVCHPMTLA